jgi:cysteine synthase A
LAKPNWSRHQRYHTSFLDAIGCTPLVQLNKITKGLQPRILAKIEWFGPSGSLKDRIYLHMMNRAEARGALRAGMTVLECSTGNAGIACSFVSALKGYRCIVVMPEGMSEERKKMMRAYGTELVFTPGAESDVDLSLQKLEEIRRLDLSRYWVPGQFSNTDNIEAHYETTGPEIWDQTGGRVDAFVASQGSGGTVSGVGKFLKEQRAQARIYAVEPAECPILAHRRWGTHGIQGIGDGFVPENLDLGILTGVITTSTDESVEMARRLAREEGIFCGISSGCNVAAAVKLARRRPDLENIVVMVNDTGQRYFSTVLCGEQEKVEVPDRDHTLDPRSVAELNKYQGGWEVIE